MADADVGRVKNTIVYTTRHSKSVCFVSVQYVNAKKSKLIPQRFSPKPKRHNVAHDELCT